MDWPWVRYYVHKGGKFWTDGETSHTISNDDIIRELAAPDITLRGHRSVHYTFAGELILCLHMKKKDILKHFQFIINLWLSVIFYVLSICHIYIQ